MLNNVSRRQFIEGAAAIAAGLGLAACSGNGESNSDSASSDGALKVGVMGPYSGGNSQYGIACRNGALLYLKQVNAEGGVNGKQIDPQQEDEKADATEAVNVYNKLVQEGVVGIVGDVTTAPTVAVAKQSVADNMPCVTPSATATDVVTYGTNFFRACVTDPEQGRVMAEFAAEQGYKTIATIYLSGVDYNEGVNNAFCETAESKGITITTQEAYSEGDVDFNAQLSKIIATNPDAILVPNYYQEDGKIVTQARQQGYNGVFLGADGWSGIFGGNENYASAADLHDCYYCCAFTANNDSDATKKFIEDYTAEYGEAPTNFCALGYDAAMVLVNGLKAAEDKGLEAGTDEYLQAVIDGIASGTVEGITGKISYNGTGDPVKSTLILTFEEDGAEKVFETIEA